MNSEERKSKDTHRGNKREVTKRRKGREEEDVGY